MSRTEEFGAQARGQTFSYLPEQLTIVTDEAHPLYDVSAAEPPPKWLVDSIRVEGVQIPIIVRKNGQKRGKPIIEVVAGRNRVKAVRLVNAERKEAGAEPLLIPAMYKRADDQKAATLMVLENALRKVEDHVTLARGLQRYLNLHGGDEKRARRAYGLTSSQMRLLLSVLEMDPSVQDALREKSITMIIAQKLAALPRSEQKTALEALLGEGKARGKDATKAAEQRTKHASRPKVRGVRKIEKALDSVSCMPAGDYREGVLHALEWVMGVRDAAWAGELAKKTKAHDKRGKNGSEENDEF